MFPLHSWTVCAESGRRSSRSCRSTAACLLTLLFLAVHLSTAARCQEVGPLEQYLVRLGLSDLHSHFLEQRLAGETNDGRQEVLARRLADVYAAQLVTAAGDPDKFAGIMQRIEALVERVPQSKTTLLEVMLLQADYYRAEALINKWLASQRDDRSRAAAQEILERIAPLLDDHQADLSRDVEQRLNEMEDLEVGEALDRAAQSLAPIQAVAGRAIYFAATSNYYLDLLAPTPERKGYQIAQRLYRKLLGIEGKYSDYNAGVLGLQSIWRARALVGLALTEAGLGNQEASAQCFSWLGEKSVTAAIRNQVPYWRLRAYASSGQFADLLQFARGQIATISLGSAGDAGSFCVGLVRAGFGSASSSAELRAIGMLGLSGLVKLRQSRAAGHLMDEYQIEIDKDSAGFYLRWLQGQQLFNRAEVSKSQGDYELAAAALEQALGAPDSAGDLNAAARCRTQLAWCHYRLTDLEQAARLFEQAASGLKATNDRGAAKSAWNAFLSYQKLAKSESRFVSSAIDVLNRIQRDYPHTKYAKDAGYYAGKLQAESLSPEELLQQLATIAPDSDSYLAARYDICRTWFQRWGEATGPARREAVVSLARSVDTYLQAATRAEESSRKVSVCLLVVQAAVHASSLDLPLARKYLTKARPFAESLHRGDRWAAEFHYRAMQLAQRANDDAEMKRHASWIVANAPGSSYQLNALISAVRLAEAELKTVGPAEKPAQMQVVFDYWQRLAELLGSTTAKISASKNARVANSKLAHYGMLLGDHRVAAQALEKLLASDPKNKSYLRRAGEAQYQLGDYAGSLQQWQTLLSGLEKGSDDWYQAKYFQLACLRQLDDSRFRRASRQFRLLYPDLGSTKWQTRFADMLPK